MVIRPIKKSDDKRLGEIIRYNLKNNCLDIPGTAYFDDNIFNLSEYYLANPKERRYYVIEDDGGKTAGGMGFSKIDGFEDCAELQKLYFDDSIKGKGLSTKLMEMAEKDAKELGFKRLYIETHSNLKAAVGLYMKFGFREIKKPDFVVHDAMNLFYIKEI